MLDRDQQRVGVARRRLTEPDGRVVLLGHRGRGRDGCFVAGEDAGQQVGRGGRNDGVGIDQAVRVAIADVREVDVVRGASAGEHRVQLLARFAAGGEPVHGVGGDALGAVDSGRVAQFGALCDVVGGQGDDAPVGVVLDGQPATHSDLEDSPAVAVLHPVGPADP